MEMNDAVTAILLGKDEAMKANLKELLDAKTAAEQAQMLARGEQEKAKAILAEAQRTRQEGLDAVKAADARKAGLDEREAELGRVNAALTEEKEKFEAVRAAATDAQDQRETILKQREASCDDREPKLDEREDEVTKRERDVDDNLASLAAKHNRLREAIKTNEAA